MCPSPRPCRVMRCDATRPQGFASGTVCKRACTSCMCPCQRRGVELRCSRKCSPAQCSHLHSTVRSKLPSSSTGRQCRNSSQPFAMHCFVARVMSNAWHRHAAAQQHGILDGRSSTVHRCVSVLLNSQASVVPRHSLRWAMLRAAPCSPIMTACAQSMERSFTKTVASMQGLFRVHAASAMFEPGAILEAILQQQQQRHSQHAVGGGACVAHRAEENAHGSEVRVC